MTSMIESVWGVDKITAKFFESSNGDQHEISTPPQPTFFNDLAGRISYIASSSASRSLALRTQL